jgi:hypothetical protein
MPIAEERTVIYAPAHLTFDMMLKPRLMAHIWQTDEFEHDEVWPTAGSRGAALSHGRVKARFTYHIRDVRPAEKVVMGIRGTLPSTLTYILVRHGPESCDLTLQWNYKPPPGPLGDAVEDGWIEETMLRALTRIKAIAEHEVSRAVIHLENLPEEGGE